MSVKERLTTAWPSPSVLSAMPSRFFVEREMADLMQVCDDLRASNHAKDELLGLIAHELRSPLAVAQLAARRLGELGRVVSAEQATVDVLQTSVAYLQTVIDDMFILARDDDQELPLEPLLLQRLLPDSVAGHRLRRPDRPIRLDADDQLRAVLGHAGWVTQVIENLLSNADKYSPAGSLIRISAVSDPHGVAVRVLDRGCGIAAGRATQLFVAFHREESVKASPGVGLGLTVCKRLVERQRGLIWAAPRAGGGSEFGFSLRIAE
jgi:signal transduction histidine kinase